MKLNSVDTFNRVYKYISEILADTNLVFGHDHILKLHLSFVDLLYFLRDRTVAGPLLVFALYDLVFFEEALDWLYIIFIDFSRLILSCWLHIRVRILSYLLLMNMHRPIMMSWTTHHMTFIMMMIKLYYHVLRNVHIRLLLHYLVLLVINLTLVLQESLILYAAAIIIFSLGQSLVLLHSWPIWYIY